MRWFLGIDGGGTKTAFAVGNEDGSLRCTVEGGGCSYQSIGMEHAAERIRAGVEALLDAQGLFLDECAGCCIGLPCYGEDPAADEKMQTLLKEALRPVSLRLVNDVEVAAAGTLRGGAGIHLVAGTGSIAFARNAAGEAARCGGWNEFFGDEGSCYWIGREAMGLFTRQADGRLPRGALYEIVRRELALEQDIDFVARVLKEYAPYRDRVAAFQRYAAQAALAGDGSALALYRRAAKELAALVRALRDRLSLPEGTPVTYSGGLFQTGELILAPLREEVSALHGALHAPERSALEGAVLLAAQKYDKNNKRG